MLSSLLWLLLALPGGVGEHRAAPGYPVARVRADRSVELRAAPAGRVLRRVGPRTPFGDRTVLGVVGRRGRWLAVSVPRPGSERPAWVRADRRRLELGRVRVALHADLSRRELVLERSGRVVARSRVAIGSPRSPTPTGRFAVTDKLPGPRFSSSYGCCILALSVRQQRTPPGWGGGDRVAIHGAPGGDPPARASSAGCLRAEDRVLRRLMRLVPAGAPVFIRQ